MMIKVSGGREGGREGGRRRQVHHFHHEALVKQPVGLKLIIGAFLLGRYRRCGSCDIQFDDDVAADVVTVTVVVVAVVVVVARWVDGSLTWLLDR